ncbi:LacI family DNA-binding transcriptional regulator [Arthrobacter sp. Sa2CUA1]|uniref:LacI family DNA-binding transcriptional regulator n=1 Tax=Arthrobacter gallicola TaxID=2762225 RepID=A0ABR8UPQ2_9MICC|nr:LacI family DNA-binding transcriptional regulator [Arthrobacter gallicola]MBD7994522.1 LacI family DNA-binding transcriptional regulator [Arthrobacter gallicola]
MARFPVSIKDVAREAQVSIGTVSNVINRPEVVSEDRRRRVLKAIDQLGYVRNDVARQLKAGRSRTIGLVVQDTGNPFYNEIARGAEAAADDHGQAVIVGNSGLSRSREQVYLDLFEEQRVRGVLITPQSDDLRRVERLRSRGTPVVLVDERAPASQYCSLAVDDVEGGRMAVAHLLAGGARNITFVGGPAGLHQVTDRQAGARAAVDTVPGATLDVVGTAALTVLEGRRVGEELLHRPAAERPTGVFAANDLLAIGLLQAFVFDHRLRVPEDIALIGYDDIDFAPSAVVPLSSIRQPARLIGRTAVELLEDELSEDHHHRHVTFQPELVVRDSTDAI